MQLLQGILAHITELVLQHLTILANAEMLLSIVIELALAREYIL